MGTVNQAIGKKCQVIKLLSRFRNLKLMTHDLFIDIVFRHHNTKLNGQDRMNSQDVHSIFYILKKTIFNYKKKVE
jgi:hypothetical protein